MEKINIIIKTSIACITVALITSCSSSNGACEDITLASEQAQQCQALRRQIDNTRGKPLIRTELERRYENDCTNLRNYRDGQQPAICGNKDRIDEIRATAKKEAVQ